MTHRELMVEAIAWLEKCTPRDPGTIPRVGAVIAIDGTPVAADHRGEDDHAEKRALAQVSASVDLSSATVYTTLEPCTHRVRTKEGESCTDRLVRAQVRKVVIGILDPNQGVCGKGMLQLQEHKIEVELFPHDLAQRIRRLNDEFIQAQRSLGIHITAPLNGTVFRGNTCRITGTFVNPPGDNVVAVTNVGDQWWPQFSVVRIVPEMDNVWEVTVNFGIIAPHKIYLIRATDSGLALMEYYRKGVHNFHQIIGNVAGRLNLTWDRALAAVGPGYLGISLASLPKGLEMLDCVAIDVVGLTAISE